MRGAEKVWSVMGSYFRSPILDEREPLALGQPEVRNYRYTYLDGNDTIGQASDTFTVTTTP